MVNYSRIETYGRVRQIMYQVFGWMGFAVGLTGITAYTVANYPPLQQTLLSNPLAFIGLLLAQLLVVIVLSFSIMRLSYPAALSLFLFYAVLTGLTLSVIFLVYTTASIVTTLFIAAGMFISMAIYGAVTEADLTAFGSLMGMMLWGLIIAMIVNLFLRSPMVDFVTAIIGVIVFAGLTAFDIQNIKNILLQLSGEPAQKVALIGALQLYLDFINLFLSLLQLMGRRKE